MSRIASVIVLYFVCMNACLAGSLKPFESDGCSAFPDGSLDQQQLWLQCCTAHDYAYWKGGTYQERVQADEELRQCVAAVGEKEIAVLMLAGVRVGGSPFWPASFRWGYGWPYPKFYGELNQDELKEIEKVIKQGAGARQETANASGINVYSKTMLILMTALLTGMFGSEVGHRLKKVSRSVHTKWAVHFCSGFVGALLVLIILSKVSSYQIPIAVFVSSLYGFLMANARVYRTIG